LSRPPRTDLLSSSSAGAVSALLARKRTVANSAPTLAPTVATASLPPAVNVNTVTAFAS
jgi:hypothetical protein